MYVAYKWPFDAYCSTTVSVGKFFSKVVKSMFSEDKPLAQKSSVLSVAVTNVVQKLLPAETTESPQMPTQPEDEPLPQVSDPRDLIPYYRRRYVKFRKVSLALTREWRMYFITLKRPKRLEQIHRSMAKERGI